MRFIPLPLQGAHLIDLEPHQDDRGFFGRFFCVEEMTERGLDTNFVQANTSLSFHSYTLRGLHYQLSPAEETKIVRCISGSLYDVIVDIRPTSPTFGKWFGVTLSKENRTMVYIPKGFAHGFLTQQPDTEILYLVSHPYCKEKERGIRWNDPAFNIKWPQDPLNISERDKNHKNFDLNTHLFEVMHEV